MKNILMVSYLKNKGVRRICFILGLLFSLFFLDGWIHRLDYNFYNEKYENITTMASKVDYWETEKQKQVFEKYPIKNIAKFQDFEEYRKFFFGEYENRHPFFSQCKALKEGNESRLYYPYKTPDGRQRLENACKEIKEYMSQEIDISKHNYKHFIDLWMVLMFFYLPFLISCVIRWVYMGFKHKDL